MTKYGVLVVDDSAVMRKAVSALIERHSDFYIIGKARNGIDALEKIGRLKPHIVTMDIEMPELNGIKVIEQLTEKQRHQIFVISNVAPQCMGIGGWMSKEQLITEQNEQAIATFLGQMLEVCLLKRVEDAYIVEEAPPLEAINLAPVQRNFDLVTIGSSTGGPAALQKLLTGLDAHFPSPILIIQHMPIGFTEALAKRFQQCCALEVKEVQHNDILRVGFVYIAPAGIHTIVKRNSEQQLVAQLTKETKIPSLYMPSVDVALCTIAPIVRQRALAVILTGMGDDCLRGCYAIKNYEGHILTQEEESCVVYGMPKVVTEAGLSNEQLPIEQMSTCLTNLVVTFEEEII